MEFKDSIVFFVNGKKITIHSGDFDPRTTLIQYLRDAHHLTGTKLGCAEGGCGACTVMLSRYQPMHNVNDDSGNNIYHFSANACLVLVASLNGYAVTTVEGIGNMASGLHPVQKRVAHFHGSQCGFCTPGIVMAIYAFLRANPQATPHEIEESLDGNLCRCTGYRPILDAAKSLSNNKGGCCGGSASGGCPCKEETPAPASSGCCGGSASGGCPCKEETPAPASSGCCGGSASGGCPCKQTTSTPSVNADGEPLVHNTSEKLIKINKSLNEEMKERGLTEPIFPPFLTHYKIVDTHITSEDNQVNWFQPSSLDSLLELREKYPDSKLIVGNTEVGIEMKFKKMPYCNFINPTTVEELQKIELSEDGVRVGGSVSINRLKTYLSNYIKSTKNCYKSKNYSAIVGMFNYFASNHIRNTASVAGNIFTASPISDLNPILLAIDAKYTLNSKSNGPRDVNARDFYVKYRTVDLKQGEIIQSVFLPFNNDDYEFVLPFKQARRREDDISIVTSCISIGLNKVVENDSVSFNIKSAAIGFGGMSVIPILTPKTQQFLEGKPWNLQTIHESFSVLRDEINLKENTPGGQVEYRMSLCLSFLLKFYYQVSLELKKMHDNYVFDFDSNSESASDNFVDMNHEKPLTRGEHEYSIRKGGIQSFIPEPHASVDPSKPASLADGGGEHGAVGKSLVHKSAESQVSGEAKYTVDMTVPKNCLHGMFVHSTVAHGEVVSIDTSEAEKMPGYHSFVCSSDIIGSAEIGAIIHDELVFYDKVVPHFKAPIGLVLADTREQAIAAADKVKVTYNKLDAIIIMEDAIEKQSFFPKTHVIEDGDLEEMKKQSDFSVSGRLRMGGQEHFYLETMNSLVIPGDNGTLQVYNSTQNCAETQKFCASVCGVPQSKVNVVCKRMGGGFGGKESRSVPIAVAASIAARVTNRPVSVVYDRDIDMSVTGQRHAFLIDYKAGIKADGTLTYLEAELYNNAGFSLDLSLSVLDRALFHSDNAYKWPSLKVTGRVCKTNQPSHTAYRGFGGPQGMLLTETVIMELARKANIDPDLIRQKNFYKNGDETHYGQPLTNIYLDSIMTRLMKAADVENRKKEVEKFNSVNKFRKRGITCVSSKFGINFTAKFLNQGGALVHIYTDGSVLVAHGGTEMGQGLYTKVIQVAAQAFGIDESKVFTSETATNTVPNASPSAASLSTDLYGMAVLHACEQLKARLLPLKERLPADTTWDQLIGKAYFERINLSAQGFYAVDTNRCGYDFEKPASSNKERGHPFNYFTQGVACSEVEIDTLTGDSRIIRADIVMDVGKSINPAIDIGQIEGAYVQGFGWSSMEELIWSHDGSLFTRGPGFYKIPGFNDVPIDFRVHLDDTENPYAVHSSKAIGEPPFFLGASAFFSIKEAVVAARKDNGVSEYFQFDSPASSERIRMSVADEITQVCQNNQQYDKFIAKLTL